MKLLTTILAAAFCVIAIGCYHATIETGLQPDGQKITQKWASGWILGLIPPKTVEAAAKCPNGVSRVETRLSFVNQLVGFLTAGIYTPMEILVECASGSSTGQLNDNIQEIIVAESASHEEIQEAFSDAAMLANKTKAPVYVRFIDMETATAEGY